MVYILALFYRKHDVHSKLIFVHNKNVANQFSEIIFKLFIILLASLGFFGVPKYSDFVNSDDYIGKIDQK